MYLLRANQSVKELLSKLKNTKDFPTLFDFFNTSFEAIDAFLVATQNTKVTDEDGETLLHYFISKDSEAHATNTLPEIIGNSTENDLTRKVKKILEHDKALLNQKNDVAQTPLKLALNTPSEKIFETVVTVYFETVDVHFLKVNRGETVLHLAIGTCHTSRFQRLLEIGKAELNLLINSDDQDGNTPLRLAFDARNFDEMIALIETGATLKTKNIHKHFKLIDFAVKTENQNLYSALIKYYAPIIKLFNNQEEKLPWECEFLSSFSIASEDFFTFGLELIPNINVQDFKGDSLLHHLVHAAQNTKIAILLNDINVQINIRNNAGCTAILIATQNLCTISDDSSQRDKYKDILANLFNKNADLTLEDNQHQTIFHHALHHGKKILFNPKVKGLQSGLKTVLQKPYNSAYFLKVAAQKNYKTIFANLLLVGCSINSTDKTGATLLHIFASKKDINSFDFALKEGVNAWLKNNDGDTALHLAVKRQSLSICERYLDKNFISFNLNQSDIFKLLLLALDSSVEIFKLLITKLDDINTKDSDERTLLHDAALGKGTDKIPVMLERKIDVKALDKEGNAAFNMALSANNVEALKYLLNPVKPETKQDIFTTDELKKFLEIALAGQQMECAKVIFNHLPKDKQKSMVENAVTQQDNIKLLKLAKITNIKDYVREGDENLLLTAVKNADAACLDTLLKQNIAAHTTIQEGKNILHIAVEKQALDCVKTIVIQANDLLNSLVEGTGETALLLAVKTVATECVKFLIEAGADITLKTKAEDEQDQKNALMLAEETENKELITLINNKIKQELLKTKPTRQKRLSESRNSEGDTASGWESDTKGDKHEFSGGKKCRKQRLLKKQNMDNSVQNKQKETCDPSYTTEDFTKIRKSYELALSRGHHEKAIETLAMLPSISTVINKKTLDTPLLIAVKYDSCTVTEYILQSAGERKKEIIEAKNSDAETALCFATLLNMKDIVELLLSYGANPNAGLHVEGGSILHRAIIAHVEETPCLETIQLLLENGAEVNTIDTNLNYAPIHVASERSLEVTMLLVNHNADINLENAFDYRPIHFAVRKNQEEIVSFLLTRGVDPNIQTIEGKNTLEMAIINKNLLIVKLLVNAHAIPNLPPATGESLVILAISYEFYDCIPHLIAGGAELNKAYKGSAGTTHMLTPLTYAISRKRTKAILLLLKNGKADPTLEDPNASPLTWAVVYDLPHIIGALINAGEEIAPYKIYKEVQSFLGEAKVKKLGGSDKCLKCFQDRIKNINTKKGNSEQTVLHKALLLAQKNDEEHIVSLFLELGSDPNIKDKNGLTALHIAASRNLKTCCINLLANDTNVNEKDIAGNTPLYMAVMNGSYVAMAILLKDPKVNANIKNDKGHTSLHLAIYKNDTIALEILLKSNKVDIHLATTLGGILPLNLVYYHASLEVLSILIRHNTDLNKQVDLKYAAVKDSSILFGLKYHKKWLTEDYDYASKLLSCAVKLILHGADLTLMHNDESAETYLDKDQILYKSVLDEAKKQIDNAPSEYRSLYSRHLSNFMLTDMA